MKLIYCKKCKKDKKEEKTMLWLGVEVCEPCFGPISERVMPELIKRVIKNDYYKNKENM
tara:strand:+ start:2358 stop:2534 length:177 start_codon:yes stop_codon:yes gene_type:complete